MYIVMSINNILQVQSLQVLLISFIYLFLLTSCIKRANLRRQIHLTVVLLRTVLLAQNATEWPQQQPKGRTEMLVSCNCMVLARHLATAWYWLVQREGATPCNFELIELIS